MARNIGEIIAEVDGWAWSASDAGEEQIANAAFKAATWLREAQRLYYADVVGGMAGAE